MTFMTFLTHLMCWTSGFLVATAVMGYATRQKWWASAAFNSALMLAAVVVIMTRTP